MGIHVGDAPQGKEESLLEQLRELNSRLSRSKDRLHDLIDRLLGSNEKPCEGSISQSGCAGSIGYISNEIGTCHVLASGIESHIDCLQNAADILGEDMRANCECEPVCGKDVKQTKRYE